MFHHTLCRHKRKHVFLAAKDVLNIITVRGFLLKSFWRKLGEGKVISHFEDVTNGEEKSYKQWKETKLMKQACDLKEADE